VSTYTVVSGGTATSHDSSGDYPQNEDTVPDSPGDHSGDYPTPLSPGPNAVSDSNPEDYTEESEEDFTTQCDQCDYCRRQETDSCPLKFCMECYILSYCSKQCQTAYWKAGHKHRCKHLRELTQVSNSTAAESTDSDD
jgi:hypothetical protein